MKLKEIVKELKNDKVIKGLLTAYQELEDQDVKIKLTESKGLFGYNVSLDLWFDNDSLQITESWNFYNKKEYENYPPVLSDQRVKEIKLQVIRMLNSLISECLE